MEAQLALAPDADVVLFFNMNAAHKESIFS